ncbi:hypothetical protein LWI28_022848 [Acer negundo]|uniref:Uncharacterized protein n=1 Tax=Acer negundo TaxID=4023 RepID=A0AAD5NHZ3_ACENE|nr:hypothetical protein LWI28_022848 [Acer negundo]
MRELVNQWANALGFLRASIHPQYIQRLNNDGKNPLGAPLYVGRAYSGVVTNNHGEGLDEKVNSVSEKHSDKSSSSSSDDANYNLEISNSDENRQDNSNLDLDISENENENSAFRLKLKIFLKRATRTVDKLKEENSSL